MAYNVSSTTELPKLQIAFTWKIKDFIMQRNYVSKTNVMLESSRFGQSDGPQFVLRIYPKGESGKTDNVGIFLKLKSPGNSKCWKSKDNKVRVQFAIALEMTNADMWRPLEGNFVCRLKRF